MRARRLAVLSSASRTLIDSLFTFSVDNKKQTHNSRLTAFALVFALTSINVNADVNGSLSNFYDGLGYHGNVSNPSAFKGQSANYYNGGSLFVRTKIQNAQMGAATLPSIEAGCNGIDAFLGGFSHISSDQLIQFGKSVVANAPPFVVDLALQTWAPQIKQIRDNLQNMADKWLNQSINSCETAQAAVSGLVAFEKPQAKQFVCATMGTQNNAFADWVSAKQACGVGGQAPVQLAKARDTPELEDLTKTSHNIVWSAIMKNAFLASDTKLAEFLMTLSGTYVYDKDGKPTYYASLLDENNNLMEALLHGGKLTAYECDDTGAKACLTLTQKEMSIANGSAMQQKILETLTSLNTSLLDDKELTGTQKGFLEYTELPMLSFLKEYAQGDGVASDSLLDKYARVIAIKLLSKYLNNMLNVTQFSLSNTQVDKSDITLISNDIARAKQFLTALEEKATRALMAQEEMIANAKVRKAQMDSAVSSKIRDNIYYGEQE
jgi:conjugative transfer pilus assembly protein TraH